MTESNSTMMREVLLDQYMTVETTHLIDRKNTDGTEGTCFHRENLAVCDVSTKLSVSRALQTEECDISRNDISLQCTVCNLYRKRTSHDHLVLHLAERKLGRSGISTVEAHEGILLCIIELALDILIVDISRYGIVNVQKSYSIVADNSADELTEGTIDINLAGNRNTHLGKTAVT